MKLIKVMGKSDAAVELKHGSRAGDGWIKGTAVCNGREYRFEVKVYDQPSEQGIEGGRISKLWLAPKGGNFRNTILNYDRKWEGGYSPKGKDADVVSVYKAIVSKFN